LTLLFFLPLIGFGQDYNPDNVSEKVQRIVKDIAKENVLMSSAVGYAGTKPKQYERFEDLKEIATVSELIELTNHDNAVVRCYAFWDLIYKDSTHIYDIVKRHLNDNEFVSTQFGCIGSGEKVGDFYLSLVSPPYYDDKSYQLSDSQLNEINEILLTTDNQNLYAKKDLLTKIEPSEDKYEQIRKIVVEEKSPQSILALSKYQKQQDIEIIERLFDDPETEYWAFRCVQFFPDTVFYKYLLDWHKKEIEKRSGFNYPKIRVFYKALVQYQIPQSIQIMETSMKKSKGFGKKTHNKYMWIALEKYNYDYFNDIKSQIKLEDFDKEELEWDNSEIVID
jgi:hypothetical protein